ncbi:MAG: DMT family transporter [Anaerolineae bacterium]|nr:DMT family transporter [Anaerolineae bacterium]
MESRPARAYIALLAIVAAAATGPIVIRQAQQAGLPSIYIIAARQILTSLILAPLVLKRYRAELLSLSPREWAWLWAGGFLFALNLLFLFLSLEFVSVLVTSVLRRTTPLWVIWLEIIFLGAVFTRKVWVGLGVNLLGSVTVGLGSGGAIEGGSNPALGMTLALVGSVSIGLYLLIGRKFGQRLPSLAYSWAVFTATAVISSATVMVMGIPLTGYGLTAYLWVLVVTAVTQFLGHIPINLGLKYFEATYISIILQVAVALSAVLAYVQFGEIPSPAQIIGSIVIMVGVFLVSWK